MEIKRLRKGLVKDIAVRYALELMPEIRDEEAAGASNMLLALVKAGIFRVVLIGEGYEATLEPVPTSEPGKAPAAADQAS